MSTTEPGDTNGYVERGKERLAQGQLDEASSDFSQAIQLDPNNVEAYLLRGQLRQQQGDFLGCVEDYAEAARLDSDLAQALAPDQVTFGPDPNIIHLRVSPREIPQGEQPRLELRTIVSACVWGALGAAIAAGTGWLYPGPSPTTDSVITFPWGLGAWLLLWSLYGAQLMTFGLCFGFGVVVSYVNGGLSAAISFAGTGALLGLVLGVLSAGSYFLPDWATGAGTGLLVGVLLLAAVFSLRMRRLSGRSDTEEEASLEKRAGFSMAARLAVLAACALLGGFLAGHGWAPAGLLTGAGVGLLVSLVVGYYIGGVLGVLMENKAVLHVGVIFTVLAGCTLGALGGLTDLEALFALLHAALRAGVIGGGMGAATALGVGLVAGTVCPGTFGGSVAAGLRLEGASSPGGPGNGCFAAGVGIFPGTSLGLWTGTVLGILHYLGVSRWGLGGWLTAACAAGGLLALIFFGTRVVLPAVGRPRSWAGMLAVTLAGAALGGLTVTLAAVVGVAPEGQGFWVLGQAACGALIGIKCWEFLGRKAAPQPLFPF